LDVAQNFHHGLKTYAGLNQASKAQHDHEVATMKTAARTTFAERLGRTLGRTGRGCARLDRRAQGWLRAQGLASGAVRAVSLVVKFAALAVLLYSAFWLALLIAFALAGAWLLHNDDGSYDKEQQTEWRYGHAGYGLYTSNDQRIDPHDPDDDQA
jgi:Protein of unknown function (DUF3742)